MCTSQYVQINFEIVNDDDNNVYCTIYTMYTFRCFKMLTLIFMY